VQQAIIASEVSVGRNCKVEPGALISYGVTVADGMTISGAHRITRAKRKRGKGEVVERVEPDTAIVGKGGDGFEFLDEDSEEEDEVVEGLAPTGLRKTSSPPISPSSDTNITLQSTTSPPSPSPATPSRP
jgi:translation initiation factor eIF-2B subunit epsilon